MYSNGPGPPPPPQHYQQPPPPPPPPHHHHHHHHQQPQPQQHYEQPPYQQAQYGPPNHTQYANYGHNYNSNYRHKRGGKSHYNGNRQYHANYQGSPEAPSPPNYSSGPYQQPSQYGQQPYPPQQQQQQHHQQRPPNYPPQQQYHQHQQYPAPSHYPPQHGYNPAPQYGPPSNPPPPHTYPPSAPPYHQQYPQASHPPPQGYSPPHGYSPPQEYGAPPPQSYPTHQPYPPPPQHNAHGYAHPQSYQQWQGPPQHGSQYPHYGPQPHHHDGRYHGANGHASRPVNGASTGDANYSSHYPISESHRRHSYPQGRSVRSNVPSEAQTDASDSVDGAQQGRSSLYSSADDWGFDFDGALWPKGNDAVDPTLSIGIIIWHPAKQATRALPSSFDLAEDLAAQPLPKSLGNGESVSLYFTLENSHEAFLNVRQTDDWPNVENDSIFYEFPAKCDMVPLGEVVALRNRPDFSDEYNSRDEPIEDGEVSERGSDWNVMDHLEEALGGTDAENHRNVQPKSREQGSELKDIAKTKLEDEQEELLARLGVSGSPKPVQPGPVAIYQAPDSNADRHDSQPENSIDDRSPPSERRKSTQHETIPQHSRNSVTSGPPQSPSREAEDGSLNPWSMGRSAQGAGKDHSHRKASPARSESSQHTLAGSDFNTELTNTDEKVPAGGVEAVIDEEPMTTSSANADGNSSRKRSHAESAAESNGRQDEENSSRSSKRRHPQVDAAYSRRW